MATYNVNTTSNVLIATIPDGADRFLSFTNIGNIGPNGTPIANNIAANAPGTGIRLLGQNSIDYGLKVDENFVHLLENFANGTQPVNALQGQLWYDTGNGLYPDGILRVCTSASTPNALAEFAVVGGGGPSGLAGEIQYSSGNGSFFATPNLAWNSSNTTLGVIGNVYVGANLRLGAGANTLSINANSSTSNYSLTLPPNAGSNGQVLTTDGLGNLSWTRTTDRIFDATDVTNVIATSSLVTISVNSKANALVMNGDNANLDGNLNATGNANISGALSVNGNITASNLNVSNTSTLNGNVTISNLASRVALGNVSNLKIFGTATSGQLLSTDGAGNLSWVTVSTAGLSNGSTNIDIPVASGNIIATVNGVEKFSIVDIGIVANGEIQANAANVNYLKNLDLNGGSNNSLLTTDGTGNLSWSTPGAIASIANGVSSINIPIANGNINMAVNGTTRARVDGNGLTVLGSNLTVTNGNFSHSGGLFTVANALLTADIIDSNVTVTNANFTISNGNFFYTVSGTTLFDISSTETNISLPLVVSNGTAAVFQVYNTNGNVDIKGDITLDNGDIINGGNIDLSGNVTANGNASFDNGNILISNGNLTVYDGAVGVGSNAYVLNASGITAIATNVAISANTFTGNTAILGNANVSAALTVTGSAAFSGANVTLGSVANLRILGGSSNNLLTTDGTGTLSWTGNPNVTNISVSSTISGSANITVTGNIAARGATTEIQYNNGGNLAGSANLTWNNGTSTISTGNITVTNLVSAANLTLSAGANISGALNVGTATGTTAGEIRASGNIIAFSPSDISLKTNIQPIQDAVYKATRIGGKTFDWTDAAISAAGGLDDYFVRREDIGVIAQDVQKVLPQAVRTRDDGLLAVDYPKLVALALESIRELKQEIEDIKARIPR